MYGSFPPQFCHRPIGGNSADVVEGHCVHHSPLSPGEVLQHAARAVGDFEAAAVAPVGTIRYATSAADELELVGLVSSSN